jgi:hypothetical protein
MKKKIHTNNSFVGDVRPSNGRVPRWVKNLRCNSIQTEKLLDNYLLKNNNVDILNELPREDDGKYPNHDDDPDGPDLGQLVIGLKRLADGDVSLKRYGDDGEHARVGHNLLDER